MGRGVRGTIAASCEPELVEIDTVLGDCFRVSPPIVAHDDV